MKKQFPGGVGGWIEGGKMCPPSPLMQADGARAVAGLNAAVSRVPTMLHGGGGACGVVVVAVQRRTRDPDQASRAAAEWKSPLAGVCKVVGKQRFCRMVCLSMGSGMGAGE